MHMSTCYAHPQGIENQPLPTPDFNIIVETPQRFRKFERTEIDDLKN